MSQASESAYHTIRQAIMNGTLPQGEKLGEGTLVELCRVSRTPVREALKRLAFEGYIETRRNSGGWVKRWSGREVREVFAARARLEGLIARLAAENETPKAPLDFSRTLEEFSDFLLIAHDAPALTAQFLEHNETFHKIIYRLADNKRLEDLMQALAPPPVVRRTAEVYDKERIRRSFDDHNRLAEAIIAGDGNWAEALMLSHIHAAAESYAHYVD